MKDTRRNLRCPAHDPAVVSPRAIITIIADLDYGRGREGIAPTTLCEDIGIRALCNVIDEKFGVSSRYQRGRQPA